jgi:hypothetical protein
MKHFFLMSFIILSTSVWGQKMFEEKLDNCSPKFMLEEKEIEIIYEPGDSIMILDIIKGADDEQIFKLKGVLAAQLIIDSIGKPCLISYDTKFNTLRKPFDIEENINSMPYWQGTGNDSFKSIFIRLFFEKKQIIVQRMGYNRNTGWNLLSQEDFYKKEPEKKDKK